MEFAQDGERLSIGQSPNDQNFEQAKRVETQDADINLTLELFKRNSDHYQLKAD